MSELKNREKRRIENDESPIWIRVQIALANEDVFSQGAGVPDYSESHSKIFAKRRCKQLDHKINYYVVKFRDI